MAIKSRNRNVVIVAAVAVIIVGIIAFLLGRGCDSDKDSSGPRAATTATTATTATRTATPAPAEPEPSPAPAPEPSPEPAPPAPAPVALEVVDRSVNPEVSNPGDILTFTVLVRGTADRVVVSGERTTGGGAFDFEMTAAGSSGDITTWTYSTAATTLTGVYRYYARAFAPDGSVVEMPGVSGYTFLIEP